MEKKKSTKLITEIACLINAISFALICVPDITSQVQGGGYTESYLRRNAGARAEGLSGAYTAVSNEPTALFYNPAGLSMLNSQPFFSSMVALPGVSRSFSSLSWGQSLGDEFGIGAGVLSYNTGSFTGRKVNGNVVAEMFNTQGAFQLGGGYKISEKLSVGLAAKYLWNVLWGGQINGNGYGFDIGTKLNMDYFTVGASIQNLGGSMNWNQNVSEEIPFTIRTGVAAEFALDGEVYEIKTGALGEVEKETIEPEYSLLVSTDVIFRRYDKNLRWVAGVESVLGNSIVLRFGLPLYGNDGTKAVFLPNQRFSAGASLRIPKSMVPWDLQVDYAMSDDGNITGGYLHSIGLLLQF